jgi:hypothetical protein
MFYREAIMTLLDEVKANIAFLDNCDTPHDFAPHEKYNPDDPDSQLYRNYRCSKCGGTLATMEAHWYKQGLKDAKKVISKMLVVAMKKMKKGDK